MAGFGNARIAQARGRLGVRTLDAAGPWVVPPFPVLPCVDTESAEVSVPL